MNAENVVKNLRVLWRADRILAEIQLRRMLTGLVARGFAALFAAFGVLMLELAAYFSLVQIWTAIAAAVALGVFNFLIAAVVWLTASRGAGTSREYETALALHNSAMESLQLQVRSFDAARAPAHGLEAILPALVVPAIGLVVKALRRSRATSAET